MNRRQPKSNMDSKEVEENQQSEKKGIGYYFGLSEVLTYFFRKKDPTRPKNINLTMMHGINKISIIMFLIAVIILIVRRLS